jgi:hypothetical protein
MPTRVCTVKGEDHRGYPLSVHVEAGSVLEAAARGMDEIKRAGGRPSALEITLHVPGQTWKIAPDKLMKWVCKSDSKDTIGLQAVKSQVREFLAKLEG